LRAELIDLALRHGVLSVVEGRSSLQFNTDYASLRTLIVNKPDVSAPAKRFLVDYLGQKEADQLFASEG
jgi:hypothetical protein